MPLAQLDTRDSDLINVWRGGLVAALEQISPPAFVVREDGVVRYANGRGHALGDDDALALRVELCAALAGQKTAHGFSATRLEVSGPLGWFLVVGANRANQPLGPTEAPGARLGLTPRQNDVLALVIEGATNRTVAELLGISERTVEVHLTSIYKRAGVENRARLVSLVLREA